MQLRPNSLRVYQPLILLALFGLLLLGACQAQEQAPVPPAGPTATSEAAAQVSPLAAGESPLAANESPLAAPREIAAGKSVVTGRLRSLVNGQPLNKEVVRLAEIICQDDTAEDQKQAECVWALDNAFSPTAITDESGYFEFTVSAGDYVLMVGDYINKHAFMTDESGDPIILTAPDGEVLDLGEHALDY